MRRSVIGNAMLLVDKPHQWTAFDCVTAVKYALKVKSLPLGHMGAMDPNATGLLVIGLGAATKMSPTFAELDKTYSGVVRLGSATDTGDAGGKVTETLPWQHVTEEAIREVADKFRGEVMQVCHAGNG